MAGIAAAGCSHFDTPLSVMKLLHWITNTEAPETFTITVHLPGCAPAGKKPFSKYGFYVGDQQVDASWKMCPPASPSGLRKIPAGDFGSTLCLGSPCPTPIPTDRYAQATEILAWSERYNQMYAGHLPPGGQSDWTMTIEVHLSNEAALATGSNTIISADPTCPVPSKCSAVFKPKVDLCLNTGSPMCNTGALAQSYRYAGGLVALSRIYAP